MEKVNNYSLVIRRGKNSFFPIEWSKLTDSNPNANEYSLQEIDAYTSKTNTASLLLELTQGNFISDEDYFSSIEIIYHDNNKTRILPEGPCFEENSKLDYTWYDYTIKSGVYYKYIAQKRENVFWKEL